MLSLLPKGVEMWQVRGMNPEMKKKIILRELQPGCAFGTRSLSVARLGSLTLNPPRSSGPGLATSSSQGHAAKPAHDCEAGTGAAAARRTTRLGRTTTWDGRCCRTDGVEHPTAWDRALGSCRGAGARKALTCPSTYPRKPPGCGAP